MQRLVGLEVHSEGISSKLGIEPQNMLLALDLIKVYALIKRGACFHWADQARRQLTMKCASLSHTHKVSTRECAMLEIRLQSYT